MLMNSWRHRFALLVSLAVCAGCSSAADITFIVVVKSSNYAQDADGDLTLLNYHFFSEIFLTEEGTLDAATLTGAGSLADPMAYEARETNYYMEGGHFDTQELVDQAFPNGPYTFSVSTPHHQPEDFTLQLEGPGGETDIPEPIRISLWQENLETHPLSIDPGMDLIVRWSEYSNGAADPRGIVDDMIFIVVADCHGERIFHTGLPFEGEYTTFRTKEVRIGAGLLKPGQPYSAFVEFPHVVDSGVEDGVPAFMSYATATYLDLRTAGPSADEACPDIPPPMDTGQTDRMEREPGG
jgi:hypothetical protein